MRTNFEGLKTGFLSGALILVIGGMGAVARAQSRLVLVERHVERPMKVVLDGPVAAHGVGEGVGLKDSGGDVGAPLSLNFFPRSIRLSTIAMVVSLGKRNAPG